MISAETVKLGAASGRVAGYVPAGRSESFGTVWLRP